MILFGIILFALFIAGQNVPVAGFFDKAIVTVLKPFLAIGIVLHHLHAQTVYLHEFERWGPLIVGIFFFISGYGLSYSLGKRPDYLHHFFRDKVLMKIGIPFVLALLVEITINFGWKDYDIIERLTYRKGPYLFPNDWFIFVLVYCYVVFMFAARCKTAATRLTFLCLGPLPLVLFTAFNGYERNWWATPLAFSVGTLYQTFEPEIIAFLQDRKGHLKGNIICAVFFGFLILCSMKFGSQVSTVVSYSTIPIWFVICMSRINVDWLAHNKAVVFLSSISFEVYLIHGIIIEYFSKHTDIMGLAFAAIVIPVSFMAAFVLHRLSNVVMRGIGKVAVKMAVNRL